MRPEIDTLFGNALQKEVSKVLEDLEGMSDVIEANFSQII
jgi:hypothetical protein